eukprot:COSAG02_NODE_2157_length_9637_cov_4.208429_5_plen_81_part_00
MILEASRITCDHRVSQSASHLTNHLHKMRTVQEGVEWLTPSDSEKGKGADSKKKKKKKNKNKKSKDDADESDDDAKGGTD